MKCPECGEECEVKECDDGIGPGEAWGAKFNDSRPYMGSDCCEVELDDVDVDPDDGRGDYEYDCRKDREAEEAYG